jgi:YHS domain-containing protein
LTVRSHPVTAVFAAALFLTACGDRGTPAPSAHPAETGSPAPSARDAASPPGEEVECPVCGLRFRSGEARATALHEGIRYHFLLEDHREAFEEAPSRYLGGDAGKWNQ